MAPPVRYSPADRPLEKAQHVLDLIEGRGAAEALSPLETYVLMATERRDKRGRELRFVAPDDVSQKPVLRAAQEAGMSVDKVLHALANKGYLRHSGGRYEATQPGNDVKHTMNQLKEILALHDADFRFRKNDFTSLERLLRELEADARRLA